MIFSERAEWKCHLAFLIPVDCICWSQTAIEKFKTYAEQFKEFAVSIPHTVDTSTRSTAVILWGLMRPQNDAYDADCNYVWRNINLQLIFQGVARAIVNIDQFKSNFPIPCLNDKSHIELTMKQNHTNVKRHQHGGANGRKKSCKNVPDQWLPALPCRSREITGIKFVKVHSVSKSNL